MFRSMFMNAEPNVEIEHERSTQNTEP